MKKVLDIERLLIQHKIEFYNLLKEHLKQKGIQFDLVHGKSKKAQNKKKDEMELAWAEYVPSKTLSIGKREMIWQPVAQKVAEYDLVIIEYANRNLINYFLILKRLFTKQKIAFWGHMRNPYLKKKDPRNLIKQSYLKQCDWWFAYTKGEKENLVKAGFPKERITIVQNAIDTKDLQRKYHSITEEECGKLKDELKIDSTNIAIYCGSIYKEKRIDFLIESADLIRKEMPDFHLLVVGAGPDANLVQEAARKRPWLHYIGPKFGQDRVIYFKLSKVFLMPGALGLAVLDSFAMETPMIVSEYEHHGPELEYLKSGVNGVISRDSAQCFADEAIKVMENPNYHRRLVEQCRIEAGNYTIEIMVENFVEGVQKCLSA